MDLFVRFVVAGIQLFLIPVTYFLGNDNQQPPIHLPKTGGSSAPQNMQMLLGSKFTKHPRKPSAATLLQSSCYYWVLATFFTFLCFVTFFPSANRFRRAALMVMTLISRGHYVECHQEQQAVSQFQWVLAIGLGSGELWLGAMNLKVRRLMARNSRRMPPSGIEFQFTFPFFFFSFGSFFYHHRNIHVITMDMMSDHCSRNQ